MKKILSILLILCISGSVAFADKGKKKKEKNTYVEINTSMGDIVVKLYNETPLHKAQFLKLVKEGFFDSLLFHRVIKDFMIQGGDPNSKNAKAGQQLGDGDAPGGRVPAEFNPALYHKKGALAAARDGNPAKASSNCQFYIVQGKKYSETELEKYALRNGVKYTDEQKEMYKNVGGTPMLDNNYTVFGEVVKGLEIVDAIAIVKTDKNDRPESNVMMKMKVLKKFKEKKAKKSK